MRPWRASQRRTALVLIGFVAALTGAAAKLDRGDPVQTALRAELLRLEEGDGFISDAYAARAFKPMWTPTEAREVIGWLERANDEGLPVHRYHVAALRRALLLADRSPRDRARFEIVMSRALASYGSDLRRPAARVKVFVSDRSVAPPSRSAVLMAAARAPSLAEHLARARQMSPVYESLRNARLRLRASAPSAERRRLDQVLLLNMERARGLPPAGRYILVDAASAKLWLYENGRAAEAMNVVAGKVSQPTPLMAGLIRYAVFDPYWNMPPDLARDQLAPEVLKYGPMVLARRRLEVLSDWSPAAVRVDPEAVDWSLAAAGGPALRVRQKPGEDNMMGRVKFMFPNRLGIYLHDTPQKALFARSGRHFSAGCVRVENPARLSAWLARPLPSRGEDVDRRADLPVPVPVYISYFTVSVEGGEIRRLPDPYGLDASTAVARDPVTS
jgi:murein L,D-transpeptidase YcbB/YkuD